MEHANSKGNPPKNTASSFTDLYSTPISLCMADYACRIQELHQP